MTSCVASVILTVALACGVPCSPEGHGSQGDKTMDNRIMIRIGQKAFAATLLDNPTAAAFKKLLPLSVTMTELNGNEKFARLSVTVPTQASTPAAIRTGDLMMYGSNTLVLFYSSFRTTYSYTNIGRLDDPTGLEGALGSGDVEVTFEANDRGKPDVDGRDAQ
jgi:hypothetical protein